jgi:hypothetical protein
MMKTRTRRSLFAGAMLALTLLVITGRAAAQTGGGYDLSWSTVDSGGGAGVHNQLRLVGTIGQPDTETMTGGSYRLGGGFWGNGVAVERHKIFLPLVIKSPA